MKRVLIYFIFCFSILTLSSFLLTPQDNSYVDKWAKVEKLEKEGLPKSALKVIDEIYKQAKNEGNKQQTLKALIYKTSLQSQFTEEHFLSAIDLLESELAIAAAPEKQILHSLLADLYTWYYEANRWKIMDRGIVDGITINDIKTWDARKFENKIQKEYLASLEEDELLNSISLESYSTILSNTEKSSLQLYPTLYDLLANRALAYFSGSYIVARNIQPTTLRNPALFSPTESFVKLNLGIDSIAEEYHVLRLYQHLVALHLEKGNDEALVDIDLKRLEYVYVHSLQSIPTHELYIAALSELYDRNVESRLSLRIAGKLANQHLILGRHYQPLKSEKYRYELNTAEEICQSALNKFPGSTDGHEIKNLLSEIKHADFNLQMPAAEVPGKPFLTFVKFKNVTTLFLKAIQLDPKEEMENPRLGSREKVREHLSKSAAYSWSLTIPDTKDHQSHSAEFAAPAMEKGLYMIFLSSDSTFSNISNIKFQSIWISGLSYLVKSDNTKGSLEMFVLQRENGKAVEGAMVEVYERQYNNSSRSYDLIKKGAYASDVNGLVDVDYVKDSYQKQFFFTIVKGDDFIKSQNGTSVYKRKVNTKVRTKTYFFTDRAIYRPGQTVYFKGILVDKGQEINIKPSFNTEVSLYDANNKPVKTTKFMSNDYGSFHGSFVIPTGGLNGRMKIKNKTGSLNILVEEYKRPTFEVVFDTVQETYKFGDEVVVHGAAENFAGNKLPLAEVNYRVVQSPIIMPYYRFYRPFPILPEVQIAYGTTMTDEKGAFEVQFIAEDLSMGSEEKKLPQRYTVYADVKDVTGEVQSATINVTIGDVGLVLTIQTPDKINIESNRGINLQATNLSGADVETNVTVKLYDLNSPDRILVDRLWNRPDLTLIDETTYISDFPNSPYGDELDKENWERTEIFSTIKKINGNTPILANYLTGLNPGEYLIEATSIHDSGDTSKAQKYVTLFSSESKKLPGKILSWSLVTKSKAEPGETFQLIIGSAEKKSQVFYEIINGNDVIEQQWVDVNRSQKAIDIIVKEAYRGGFQIRTALVRHNRMFYEVHNVEVPFTNKKLEVSLETRRDFLSPGKKEEWRVKISGPDGESLSAEALAGMYDASLDKFEVNKWKFDLYTSKHTSTNWSSGYFGSEQSNWLQYKQRDYVSGLPKPYPELNWFNYQKYGHQRPYMLRGASATANSTESSQQSKVQEDNLKDNAEGEVINEQSEVTAFEPPAEEKQVTPMRTNFSETAFFYPQLLTDSLGNVVFSFTTPDALTEWKFMLLAYSKDLKTGSLVEKIKAKKELMIIPNLPRFVREGDQLDFSAKVVNFTDEPLNGNAEIEFYDALTMKPLRLFVEGVSSTKTLKIDGGKSQSLHWSIQVPDGLSMIGYRVIAQTGSFTDGEERLIPVLTNRMLVTETMPLPINGKQDKKFTFKKLADSKSTSEGSTISNYKFTLEFTSNPAWYAIQAMPYLESPKVESAGNLFRQYFSNAMSQYILSRNPKIGNVIESWKSISPDAFYSNLQKNEELKSIVLNATPWVLEAEDEAEQKRRIAMLFDLNRMSNNISNALIKLKQNQLPTGAWPWFKGMREDRHTTQYIVLGMARLHNKGVVRLENEKSLKQMLVKAVNYLDEELKKDYDKLVEKSPKYSTTDHLGSSQIEYLYLRTLLLEELPIPQSTEKAFDFYASQAKKYWLKKNNYLQAMIAISLRNLGDRNQAEGIMRSLKERALFNDEMGMYWRTASGWYWYQAPVESQAMLIEAFSEVMNDASSVEKMKVWLLKQKQTTRWSTSTATAEAVYALLMNGNNPIEDDQLVQVKVGGEPIDLEKIDGVNIEPGTGYFKTTWSGKEVQPALGTIEVSNPNKGIAWGAAYWQYFEDLDKITTHDSPLSIEKIIYLEQQTDEGPVIKPLEKGHVLHTGEKLIVRLVIRSDRNMDYVHISDMRATALEPIQAISGYTFSGGLGYYKSVTDVGNEFFIRTLSKGTFVLEYPLVVTQKGNFSNGIATIQSYYAPEFAAHSKGMRIHVK